MKTFPAICVLWLFVAAPLAVPAEDGLPPPPRAADLAAPVKITAGGQPIDVDGFAAPFWGDFDEDGTNDLLVGQVAYGRLRIYRNVGTNARPRFDSFEWFTVGERIVGVPTGCRVGFTPQLTDFDGDGRTDVLTGSFYGGGVYLFRRHEDGTFAEAEVLQNLNGDVRLGRRFPGGRTIPYNVTAWMHDVDGDGDGDLLLGRSAYSLVLNEGTRREPVFAEAAPILILGEPIPTGNVPPCVADWDGDGRNDLLAGRGSDIVWYRNVGHEGQPRLVQPQILVSADAWSSGNGRPEDAPARPQAVCAADFNGDGRLDLLLGDFYFVRREAPEEQRAKMKEAAEKENAIRSAVNLMLRDEPRNENPQQRAERYRKALRMWQELGDLPWVRGGQGSTPSYERHGRVWLYRRIEKREVQDAG